MKWRSTLFEEIRVAFQLMADELSGFTVVVRYLRPEFSFPAKIEMAFFQIYFSHQIMV